MSNRVALALWIIVGLGLLVFVMWLNQPRTYIAATPAAVLECAPLSNPCDTTDCDRPKPMEMT